MKSYKPLNWKVIENFPMTADTNLVTLQKPPEFDFNPGQFVMAGIWGKGECPISICSSPTDRQVLQLCIRKVGDLTTALAERPVGKKISGSRPYRFNY